MNPGNAETPRAESGAFQEDSAAGGKSAANVPHGSDIVDLWERAEMAWAMGDFPKYGSPECGALDDNDPRKLAAMLSAAEKWRQYLEREGLWGSV